MPLITFEGIEGMGKSTQLELLRDELLRLGLTVTTTFEPGDTPLGREIRHWLLHAAERPAPATELLLYLADRAEHCVRVLKPALSRGDIVLCDRFSDATFAYQGGGRGISEELIATLNQFASSGITADLTVLFDGDPELGLRRAAKRGEPDFMEQEKGIFFQTVRQRYLDRAVAEPSRFLIVQAALPIADQAALIRSVVTRRWPVNS